LRRLHAGRGSAALPRLRADRLERPGPPGHIRLSKEIISRQAAEDPSRRVVRLVITDERGSYEITFDDGSGGSMIVD
jgi:hypothetical protein